MANIVLFKQASEITNGITAGSDDLTVVYRVYFDTEPTATEAREDIIDHLTSPPTPTLDLETVPLVVDTDMFITGPQIEQVAPKYFNVTIKYERQEVTGPADDSVEITYSFSNRLESTLIRHAKFQERMPVHGGTDPIGKLLNVDSKGEVQGANALVPVSLITIKISGTVTTFNATWHAAAEDLVGHCNNATRVYLGRTYQIGELRLLGFSGSLNQSGRSEFVFEIGYKKQVPNMTVIDGITTTRALYGWEQVWPHVKKTKDDTVKKLVPKTEAIYVYRDTWELKSFAAVGL